MNGEIDKQSFLTLTEKTSQSDFLQLRQQNAKILHIQSTSNHKLVLFSGNNNTFLQSDHSSV